MTLSATPVGWLIYVTVAVLACLVGFLVVIAAPQSERPFLYFALIGLAFITVAFGCIRGYRQRGYFDFTSPFVLMPLMYLVIYGIGAVEYEDVSKFADGSWLLWLLLLGLICYVAGAVWMNTLLWRRPRLGAVGESPGERDYTTASNVAMCIGLLAMAYYWAQSRGIPVLKSNLENSRVAALAGEGIPFYLSMLVMPAVWFRYRTIKGRLTWRQIGLCVFAALVLISTGWRNTAVALVVVALIIRHYQRPFAARRLLAFAGTLVLLISAVGLYRVYSSSITNYETYQNLRSGNYLAAFWTYVQTYPASFTYAFATVVNSVPGQLPFQHGSSFYWNFQLLSPGHHPLPYDFIMKEKLHVGFAGGGLPPTIVGEWYLNFGAEGIVLGMIFLGALCAYVHHRLTRKRSGDLAAILATVILYYLSVTVRGGFDNINITVVWLCLVITVLHLRSPMVRSGRGTLLHAAVAKSATPIVMTGRAPSVR